MMKKALWILPPLALTAAAVGDNAIGMQQAGLPVGSSNITMFSIAQDAETFTTGFTATGDWVGTTVTCATTHSCT